MPTTLRIEIFPTDLDATADFYTRVLGFTVARDDRERPDPYLALERDQVRIGAAAATDPVHPHERRPPRGVEVVLEVDDVGDERRRVVAADWPLVEDLREQPWGLRDFRLLDPSGYYVRITERTAQS